MHKYHFIIKAIVYQTSNRLSVSGLVQCALPYVLMTCRKLSKSDDRLLQLFLFGSSAVAKLRNITKYITTRRAPLQISML